MTCQDPSNSALARPMPLPALKNAQLDNMLRHGLRKANEEMMQADSKGVNVHFASTTTWPLITAVPEEMHREIVSRGSHNIMEKIGSTTIRPPKAAAHSGAYGGASSKESARYKEHFGVTTPQGSGVAMAAKEHGCGHHQ
ncbi:hypothetical protein CJ030_MR3G001097 [Morella rubra]|uniref:Uncharacterized protein n=1 Tax=Morella rubra TaxID=262757 RepID=A0A6A1W9F2_9ROSI|nr:hypothetical protein CJ030_MR3G001097 [Morella rubra]